MMSLCPSENSYALICFVALSTYWCDALTGGLRLMITGEAGFAIFHSVSNGNQNCLVNLLIISYLFSNKLDQRMKAMNLLPLNDENSLPVWLFLHLPVKSIAQNNCILPKPLCNYKSMLWAQNQCPWIAPIPKTSLNVAAIVARI